MSSPLNIDILAAVLPHLDGPELVVAMRTCRAIYPHVLPYIYADISPQTYPILARWGGWPRFLKSLQDDQATHRIKHIRSLKVDAELSLAYDYLIERNSPLHSFTNVLSRADNLNSLIIDCPCDAVPHIVQAIATGCPALRKLTFIDIWQEQVHHLSDIPWPLTFLDLHFCPNDSHDADEDARSILEFFAPFSDSLKELRLGFSVLYPYPVQGFLESSASSTAAFPSLRTLSFKDCYPFEKEKLIGLFPALEELSYRGEKQTLSDYRPVEDINQTDHQTRNKHTRHAKR